MTVVLHYLQESRSRRILWALEELKVPYEIKLYARRPNSKFADPKLLEIHPSGQSPLLEDNGKVFAESALILDHLIEKYGAGTELAPHNHDEEMIIREGEYAAESNIMIYVFLLGVNLSIVKALPWGLQWLASAFYGVVNSKYAEPNFNKTLSVLQSRIDKNGGFYANGRLTAADIMYETSVFYAKTEVLPDTFDEKFPGLSEWMKRLSTRAAYKRAHEKELELDSRKL